MVKCPIDEQQLIMLVYDELDGPERSLLETHAAECPACREQVARLRELRLMMPSPGPFVPDEALLARLRAGVMQRIREPGRRRKPLVARLATVFRPLPALQIGLAMLIFLAGYFIGNRPDGPDAGGDLPLSPDLLTTSRRIQAANGAIHPLLAGVEKLEYDPATGVIQVYYTTINDIQLKSNIHQPDENTALTRHLLQQALLDDDNLGMRLRAVKVLKSMAENRRQIDGELVNSLTALLPQEKNAGVRLKVLQALKSLLPNRDAHTALVDVLLNDENPALRIEAIDIFMSVGPGKSDIPIFRNLAENDSSDYIRSQSRKLVKQFAGDTLSIPGATDSTPRSL